MQAELKQQHSAQRAAYWASHRSVGGGALCNTSADCSHHGACRPPAKTKPPNITWSTWSVSRLIRGGGGVRDGWNASKVGGSRLPSRESSGGVQLRLDAQSRCFCDEGFAGARCSYAAFAKLSSGGATCNVTLPCGGEGSTCVRSRCVCGRGWLGARCSFASFSVLAGLSGGAHCNSSEDCGGEHTGASCDRHLIAGATIGRCRCGPGRVGARCAYAAFGDLEGGGGSCNVSTDCGGAGLKNAGLGNPITPKSTGSNNSGFGAANASRCIQNRCVCATGLLGARCAYTANQLLISARARARREQERVRSYHLCLSAWRAGDAGEVDGQEILDGTPLAFSLCRRGQNQHQRWLMTPEGGGTNRLGPASSAGLLRIRSERKPDLCVTVPPLFTS